MRIVTIFLILARWEAPTFCAEQNLGRVVLDLSGDDWRMEGMLPGRGVKEHLYEADEDWSPAFWSPARVPGDPYTDLWRSGRIEDPYFGRNLEKAKWVQQWEWWYSTRFEVPPGMHGKTIRAAFEGVDYACDVWLNGIHLGRHEGMFSAFDFDITNLVHPPDSPSGRRRNSLVVKIDPPPLYLERTVGKRFFGVGDYWRYVSPMGIWRPVKIVATGPVSIEDTYVKSEVVSGSEASLEIEVELKNHSLATQTAALQFRVEGKSFQSEALTEILTLQVNPGLNKHKLRLDLEDPKLWWPWDQGEQNLYRLEVTAAIGDQPSDRAGTTFGVRTVTAEMNPGFTKDEVEYPYTLRVNGRRLYLRSAVWGGPPSILYGRNTMAHYRKLLTMAKEANINNLRGFGWHPPEIPEFYDLCDEMGITIWHWLPFTSQKFPHDAEFLDGAIRATEEIVKERRNHPSLVMWQGGEEVLHRPAHLEGSNRELMFMVGDAIRPLSPLPYLPHTAMSVAPSMRMGFKPKENMHAGERFYRRAPMTIEEYYPSLDYAIIPEIMVTSAPSVESIRRFIPENELWPPGPSWRYHWADLDMMEILNVEVFGESRMDSPEQFVESTQIAQGTEFQYALEHFRRQKPRVSGTGICHLITFWPDMKWGIIDYYGNPKLSHGMVRNAYQPLLVSLEYYKRRWQPGEDFQGGLWIVNDQYGETRDGKLQVRVLNRQKETMGEQVFDVKIEQDSSINVSDFRWSVPRQLAGGFDIELALMDSEGNELSANHYAFLIGDEEAARKQRLEIRERLMKGRENPAVDDEIQ